MEQRAMDRFGASLASLNTQWTSIFLSRSQICALNSVLLYFLHILLSLSYSAVPIPTFRFTQGLLEAFSELILFTPDFPTSNSQDG